jgi:hypothetical protein
LFGDEEDAMMNEPEGDSKRPRREEGGDGAAILDEAMREDKGAAGRPQEEKITEWELDKVRSTLKQIVRDWSDEVRPLAEPFCSFFFPPPSTLVENILSFSVFYRVRWSGMQAISLCWMRWKADWAPFPCLNGSTCNSPFLIGRLAPY